MKTKEQYIKENVIGVNQKALKKHFDFLPSILTAMDEYAKQESAELLEALIEIAKGEGAFDFDRLIHANNTIENMKSIAQKAIKKETKP